MLLINNKVTIKKYKKRPLIVEAIQWDGSKDFNSSAWTQFRDAGLVVMCAVNADKKRLIGVDTLEGIVWGNVGHYIVRDIKGEFYVCAKDVFEASYDLVKS